MNQELKFHIQNYKETEKKLKRLGGIFLHELHVSDIYFKQPEGKVLKITIDDTGFYLVQLTAILDKFHIDKYQKLKNVENVLNELSHTYKVNCVIYKLRRFWQLQKYNININVIPDVGDFIIFEGVDLKINEIRELPLNLGKHITVSFDQLKCGN